MTVTPYLLSLLCGIGSEVFMFSHGEWDYHSPRVVQIGTSLAAGSTFLFWVGHGLTFTASVRETVLHATAILFGLFGSMTIYRLFFHPLRAFPGPIAARISTAWIIQKTLPNFRFFLTVRELHKQYGDFVRIKPREISICHPDAVVDVHGPKNKMRKSELYHRPEGGRSLQMERDPLAHSRYRRNWDKAFQSKALQEYVPRLKKHYRVLLNVFARHAASGEPVNASDCFTFLGFDLMSELTFGKSWNELSTGKYVPFVEEFVNNKRKGGFLMIDMWLLFLLLALPPIDAHMNHWQAYFKKKLQERAETPVESPDFFTHLSLDGTVRPDDAHLAIIAGSDTVAYTLSNVFWLLCEYPQYQEQLYEEVGSLSDDADVVDDRLLMEKPCLLSIINETLRLYPPAPAGVQRLTPPEGARICGRYIPGNTVVTTPTYSVQRDKRAFVKPDDFIPERWSSRPELILRKDAFFPFSYGAYNCAGKPMAMMELRMIIAMIVKRFTVSIPPGKEAVARRFIEDQADCFVMDIKELPLLLRERKGRN